MNIRVASCLRRPAVVLATVALLACGGEKPLDKTTTSSETVSTDTSSTATGSLDPADPASTDRLTAAATVDAAETALPCSNRLDLPPSDPAWQPECAQCGIPDGAVEALLSSGRAVMVNCSCPPGVIAFKNVRGTATLFSRGVDGWPFLARTDIGFADINGPAQKNARQHLLDAHAADRADHMKRRIDGLRCTACPLSFRDAERLIAAGKAAVLNCCAPGALAARDNECATSIFRRDRDRWTWMMRLRQPLAEAAAPDNLTTIREQFSAAANGVLTSRPCIEPNEASAAGIALPECGDCKMPSESVEPLKRMRFLKQIDAKPEMFAYKNNDGSATVYQAQSDKTLAFVARTAIPYEAINEATYAGDVQRLPDKPPYFVCMTCSIQAARTSTYIASGVAKHLDACGGIELLALANDACTTSILQRDGDLWKQVKAVRVPLSEIDSPAHADMIRELVHCSTTPRNE
jgi:hypothetical protein